MLEREIGCIAYLIWKSFKYQRLRTDFSDILIHHDNGLCGAFQCERRSTRAHRVSGKGQWWYLEINSSQDLFLRVTNMGLM